MLLTIILGVYGKLKTRTNVVALYVYITKMKKWHLYIDFLLVSLHYNYAHSITM